MRLITDGACGKAGDGGWAFVLDRGKDGLISKWGKEAGTTNQRMEMTAVARGLQYLFHTHSDGWPCRVEIISDSAYIVNCFKDHWDVGWKQRGWKTSAGRDVANQDLWRDIFKHAHTAYFDITWVHVRGHNGHEMNELVDKLAVEARLGLR